MALAPSEFNDGDVSIGAKALEVSINIGDTTDPLLEDWQFLCAITADENISDSIDTWKTLCGEGQSESAITGGEYSIPYTAKLRKGDLTEFIYKNRLNSQARQNLPMRIDNTLMDNRTEFVGMLSVSTITGSADTIMEISGELRLYVASTLLETSPIPTTLKNSILNSTKEQKISLIEKQDVDVDKNKLKQLNTEELLKFFKPTRRKKSLEKVQKTNSSTENAKLETKK